MATDRGPHLNVQFPHFNHWLPLLLSFLSLTAACSVELVLLCCQLCDCVSHQQNVIKQSVLSTQTVHIYGKFRQPNSNLNVANFLKKILLKFNRQGQMALNYSHLYWLPY